VSAHSFPAPLVRGLQIRPNLTQQFVLIAACAFFLLTSFRYGWNRAASDFPNYYTAAVLVRQRQPLHEYYDWTWFQRQMRYAGLEQLGAYCPQTPLTMLPLVGIAAFPVQTAKRIWLAFSLGCLLATVWLLSRVTRFSMELIALLVFAGYPTLHFNFLYGQYYVFLLFLLTLAFYCFDRARNATSGVLLGIAFALKLYGGPFAVYFAVKQRWKGLAAMITVTGLLALLAIAIFGWRDIVYFGTHSLPRALEGETLDPYSSLNGTLSTLLRRSFISEPELNPQPLWNAPAVFFFLKPLLTLAVLIFPLIAISGSNSTKRDFAWFFIAVVLASPNTGSYTFLLLLLPVTLLLEGANRRTQILLVACYALMAIPLQPAWSWLFPKVWLLVALFVFVGREYWHLVSTKAAYTAASLIIVASAFSAALHLASYSREPAQHWDRIAVQRGTLLSLSPAIVRSGLVYQTIGKSQYVLRWVHDGRVDELRFPGDALQPVAESPDGPVRFELVAHGKSTFMLLDTKTGRVVQDTDPSPGKPSPSSISPDRNWTATTQQMNGTDQIWLRPLKGTTAVQLTGGNCNSSSPIWDLDSKGIVFASDCGRGVGWPALYRARLETIQKARNPQRR
jgi:Glycosyltransferase family 87